MLHSMGFSTQIKKKKPLLKKTHIEARLNGLKLTKIGQKMTGDVWCSLMRPRLMFGAPMVVNTFGEDLVTNCNLFILTLESKEELAV